MTDSPEPTPASQHGRPPLPETTLVALPDRLRQAVTHAGWLELMPVQARSIPYLLAGRDVTIQARTGSGWTPSAARPRRRAGHSMTRFSGIFSRRVSQ